MKVGFLNDRKIDCFQAYVCTFQPRNLTVWGSEGVELRCACCLQRGSLHVSRQLVVVSRNEAIRTSPNSNTFSATLVAIQLHDCPVGAIGPGSPRRSSRINWRACSLSAVCCTRTTLINRHAHCLAAVCCTRTISIRGHVH